MKKVPLGIDAPKIEGLRAPKWKIVTPDNVDKIWEDLEKKNDDKIIFGVTDEGYEDFSILMKKIINHIEKQRLIIDKYREYYEPKPEK